jgi:hypothetical protein
VVTNPDGPDARVAGPDSTISTNAQPQAPVRIISNHIRQPFGMRIERQVLACNCGSAVKLLMLHDCCAVVNNQAGVRRDSRVYIRSRKGNGTSSRGRVMGGDGSVIGTGEDALCAYRFPRSYTTVPSRCCGSARFCRMTASSSALFTGFCRKALAPASIARF